jgi:hypothetical protein
VSVSYDSLWLFFFHNWPLGCWIINDKNAELNWNIEITKLLNITVIHMLILWQGQEIVLFSIVSRRTSGPTQLASQWVPGGCFIGGKAAGAWNWPSTFTPWYTFTELFVITLSKGQIYVINITATIVSGAILFMRNTCSTCINEWVRTENWCSYPLFLNTSSDPLALLRLVQSWG